MVIFPSCFERVDVFHLMVIGTREVLLRDFIDRPRGRGQVGECYFEASNRLA